MIALHARRSRRAIEAWRALQPQRALLVAMTGTDLYRDLPAGDAATRSSLEDADRIIVLQADAPRYLPEDARHKADVIHQSARPLVPFAAKARSRLHCLLVAHLRDEKDPRTVFAAWRALPHDLPATLAIVGAALDPSLAIEAHALAVEDARVQMLGAKPHPWTRQAIRRAHLLLVPSRMEGGANVVVEAVTAGTAVLASRISGNLGMLGSDYPGYFDVGDAAALAAGIVRAHRDRAFLATLVARCLDRQPLFAPQAEAASLIRSIERARSGATGRMT